MSNLRERIDRWIEHGPALFAAEVMNAKPTDQQWQASRALGKRRKVSIRSGHGTGKSTFMAWTILWAMTCFAEVKIPVTAPTSHQLEDVLWAELAMWHRKMPDELRLQFVWKGDRFERVDDPAPAFAVARTSRREQPEALQGFHAPVVVFIIDEASGIPNEIFQVAEGALSTAGAYCLMASNPTRMEGYFYDSHNKDRAQWAPLWWNGEDSPLVSHDYVTNMAAKYGTQSAIYRIRVRGEFAGNPDGVIPLDLVEGAVRRDVEVVGRVRWGLDVARFGEDRTALAKRRGNALTERVKSWQGKDTMQVAGLLLLEYDETPDADKPEAICVDVIGIGSGVVDRAKELGLPVVGVNVAESASVRDQYNRQRDELWFEAREWFSRRDSTMPPDDALIAELTLPSFKVLSNGKKQVQSKDDLKRAGVISPDLADAFCLTFARVGAPRLREREKAPVIVIGDYAESEQSGAWMGS